MKHLPKHIRPRRRYLAVGIEAWPDADVSRGAFQRNVWFAAQNLLGDAGSADADMRVLSFEFEDGRGQTVIRVRRGHVERARAALACIDTVRDDPVGIHVRGVSGTVRACEEKFLSAEQDDAGETTVTFDGHLRRAVRRGDLLEIETDRGYVGAMARDVDD